MVEARATPEAEPSSGYAERHANTRLASWIVAGTGALWGVYWYPVRRLAEAALPGAWGALAIVAAAGGLLAPLALRRRHELVGADRWALASVPLSGAAFVPYSVGFVYGRVANSGVAALRAVSTSPALDLVILDAGAADFVTKPIHPAVVRARVRTQLRLAWAQDDLEERNRTLEAELPAGG